MSQLTGEGEEAENRGQKRKATEALVVDATEQQDSCKLLELPLEVLSLITSLQGEKDRF